MLNLSLDPTKELIHCVKKLFELFDSIEKTEEEMSHIDKSSTEYEKSAKFYNYLKGSCRRQLQSLYCYECNYNSFEKYLDDEKKLAFLKELYEEYDESIKSFDRFMILKDEPPGSERKARKQLKEYAETLRKRQPLAVKLFAGKIVTDLCEEQVYAIRDWLINDFDDLIEKIEGARQEYIIKRRGKVKYDEVEDMLNEKFPDDYREYRSWVMIRQREIIAYYPDLRMK